MAKISKSMSFKNCIISKEDLTITEVNKDYTEEYDLNKILGMWDGVEGVSITIKLDNEMSPLDGGDE